MGAICALGDEPRRIHEALCEGRRGFGAPTLFPGDIAAGCQVAEVRDFTAQNYVKTGNVRPLDRTGRLALVGVELTLANGGWTAELRAARPVGLILGTMFCSVRTIGEFDRRAQQAGPEYASPMDFSNTVLNAAAGQVAIWQKLRGINTTVSVGAASGAHAIGYAAQMIRNGRADALVAGGAEEVCYESFFGAHQAGRLVTPNGAAGFPKPFDARRTGTLMGEGAAFLVLEAEEAARGRGATIIARVKGFGTAFDPAAVKNEPVHAVGGLSAAIAKALKDAGVSASDIDVVVSSASGSRELDAREGAAITAIVGPDVPVSAIKSMTGEALGASGALQAISAIETMRTGRLPGIPGLTTVDPAVRVNAAASSRNVDAKRALVTSLSSEGNCCALVLALD